MLIFLVVVLEKTSGLLDIKDYYFIVNNDLCIFPNNSVLSLKIVFVYENKVVFLFLKMVFIYGNKEYYNIMITKSKSSHNSSV